MDLSESTLESRALGAERTIWFEPAASSDVWIFLDGELYLQRVGAADVVEEARARGVLPPARCVFVSHGGAAARHEDFVCRPAYNAFLRDELLPHLARDHAVARPLLVGLSLSALAAAFAVVECPEVFPRAVCQSPSAWWEDEWLLGRLARAGNAFGRYYVSVGTEETETDVRHPPSGMHQGVSQLDSVTRLAEGLERAGHAVRFATFSGGHDPACWAAELPGALAWAAVSEAVWRRRDRGLPADDPRTGSSP